LLSEGQCQTLKELAEALNVTEIAVFKRLKSMEIQKSFKIKFNTQ